MVYFYRTQRMKKKPIGILKAFQDAFHDRMVNEYGVTPEKIEKWQGISQHKKPIMEKILGCKLDSRQYFAIKTGGFSAATLVIKDHFSLMLAPIVENKNDLGEIIKELQGNQELISILNEDEKKQIETVSFFINRNF